MKCIYKIQINDRYYIGSAHKFETRKQLHLINLNRQKHPNRFLQNLYNKYGKDALVFSVIEIVPEEEILLDVEQGYLDVHFGTENCINLTPVTGGGFYYIRTPEIIQKQLDTRRKNGNWYITTRTPIEAIAASTGCKRTEDFCKNMSKIKKEFYKDNPEKLKNFKDSALRGSKNWWSKNRKPFILIKNGIEYGPYTTQADAFKTKILSEPSINKLLTGKRESINGYSIKKLYQD